jgi:hypothetical protein
MYEHGVRTRVIERIMGWAPRQMHERHYLRVADEPMREAILTLYHEDPISDRHTAALALRPVESPKRHPAAGLKKTSRGSPNSNDASASPAEGPVC